MIHPDVVMNYKNHSPKTNRHLRRTELNARGVVGYEYPGRIAREVVERKEFRAIKKKLIKK